MASPRKVSGQVEKDLAKLPRPLEGGTATPKIVGEGDDAVTGDRFLVYGTDRGLKIDVRYQGDNLWMTQRQMSDLFGRDVSVISRHAANVIEEGELPEEGNLQKMQIAQGKPTTLYSIEHYWFFSGNH